MLIRLIETDNGVISKKPPELSINASFLHVHSTTVRVKLKKEERAVDSLVQDSSR